MLKMQKMFYLILALITMLLGLTVLINGEIGWGILFILAALVALVKWKTIDYSWKCGVCGTVFDLDFSQRFSGLNVMPQKILYCPSCQKKTWCKGIQK